MASIKNNEEIANLLTDGLVCLCGSYRGIDAKLKQFQNQLKVPSSIFKGKKTVHNCSDLNVRCILFPLFKLSSGHRLLI